MYLKAVFRDTVSILIKVVKFEGCRFSRPYTLLEKPTLYFNVFAF